MKAYVFPGQGSQFIGMGKDLYEKSELARKLFNEANAVLGFSLTDIMFSGAEEELKQTNVTQPAIFTHSYILAKIADIKPSMVAGHSLGEISALAAAGVMSFADALSLVSVRAAAMQKACELNPSTMAAILGLDDKVIIDICADINAVVVPANFNCPGQVVISGSNEGIDAAIAKLSAAGAKRALKLAVSGAFHSPLMLPAMEEFKIAVEKTTFNAPICPVYQNVIAGKVTNPSDLKLNVIKQLVSPVRWTESVQAMINDGVITFAECGPGAVLQGLIKKIDKNVAVEAVII